MPSTAMKLRVESYWPSRPRLWWGMPALVVVLLALLGSVALGLIPALPALGFLGVAALVGAVVVYVGARHEAAAAQPVLHRIYQDHLEAHLLLYRYLASICDRPRPTDGDLRIVCRRGRVAAAAVTAAPEVIGERPELVSGPATQVCLLTGILSRSRYKELLDTARARAVDTEAIPADAQTLDEACQALSRQFTSLVNTAMDLRDARALAHRI